MNLALLRELTRRDLLDRYTGSILGGIWLIIHPLVMIFVFVIIFAQVMGARLPEMTQGLGSTYAYGVYLVSGLLPWIAFSATLGRVTQVFVERRHLISHVRLELRHLPMYVPLADAITFVLSLLLFMAVLFATGFPVTWQVLWVIILFPLTQMFAYGLGLFLGALNAVVHDVGQAVSVIVYLWFWLTPIVWVREIVPPGVHNMLATVNPAYWFVESYHDVFVRGTAPAAAQLVPLFLSAVFVLILGQLAVRALEGPIRDHA